MSGAEEGVSEMVVGKNATGVQAAFLGVVIHVPFHTAGQVGIQPQPGDNGRKPPRIGQKRNTTELNRRVEDVADARH